MLDFVPQKHLSYYLLHDKVPAKFSRDAKRLNEDSVVVDIKDGVLFGPKTKKLAGVGGAYKGACHCQYVHWEVSVDEEDELNHMVCRCDMCKKLGGGPYNCIYIVP